MSTLNKIRRTRLSKAVTAALAISIAATGTLLPTQAAAQRPSENYRPSRQVLLSIGEGELVSLPSNVANVWTSNPEVADIQVNSPRQIGLFGKTNGEATVIATAASGEIIYGAQVRVSQNISSLDEMMRAAMPGSNITVTHVGQIAVINGTVASPDESTQAELLVRALLNPGQDPASPTGLRILPVNRLRVATPMQVMLQVKIAEVNRSLLRDIGVNLQNIDPTGGNTGFVFTRGREVGEPNETGGFSFARPDAGSSVGLRLSDLFGLNAFGSLDLNETSGMVTTLAEPTLSALSGETASFLAGGEFPVPSAQGITGTTIEFKQYGVSLAFTPIVLEGGRISMRVRPEVSELSTEGAIRLNGFQVPSLTTRRAETTVELGSGQSFMIAGLMRNGGTNSVERTPGLGRLPVIGALFRSNGFRRNETELVIIVTPYLVRPVNAGDIALPTDGFRSARTVDRVMLDRQHDGRTGERRPGPTMAVPQTVAPGIGQPSAAAAPVPMPAAQPRRQAGVRRDVRQAQPQPQPQASAPAAAPGFNF
jgi:pilus assembly protein CpaC